MLVHINMLDMLFAVFSYVYTAADLEHDLGTVKMIHRFGTMSMLILITFTAFCYASGLPQISAGLWPIVFMDLAFHCMKQPEQSRK